MNRVVLITGAAGSIGSQISPPIQGATKYILIDRDEWGLFHLKQKFRERQDVQLELADIQDEKRMKGIFEKYNPGVVIHAAAYKQLPFLEEFPYEAYKNNTLATMNLLDWSAECGIEEFIYISTDKAVYPTSHLGKSKRLGEQYVLQEGSKVRKKIIRFGNVIHSRGAVQESFENQLKQFGHIELTHEEMERYFLSSDQLIAGMQELSKINESGLFVMKMGAPRLILNFAQEFLLSKGYSEDAIQVVGIRPGEKLQEQLHFNFENLIQEFNFLNRYSTNSEKIDWLKIRSMHFDI